MAKIVNITLKSDDKGKWTIGVVRDDTYAEVTSEDTHEIDNEIKKIVDFVNKIKTKEEIEKEEAEIRVKKMYEYIKKNTTLDERLNMKNLLPRWKVDEEYKKGDERTYNDVLYIANKDHKSTFDNIPVNSKELWKKALSKAEIPDIYNHEKKYQINEKCVFNRRIYTSLIIQEGQSPFASPKTWEDEGEV